MTRPRLLAVLVASLTAALAPAQSPEVQDQVNRDLDTSRANQRTEDVEVLRRILNRSLGMPDKVAIHPQHVPAGQNLGGLMQPNQFMGQPPQQPLVDSYAPAAQRYLLSYAADPTAHLPRTSAAYGPFDGVHLPGQGVVYTLHIPENVALALDPPVRAAGLADACRKCHEVVSKGVLDGGATAEAPLTEWDRARRELLGQPTSEKPSGPAKLTRDQICDPGNLAELILGALARNAKNVRHLAKEEKITVVVTFDGSGASAQGQRSIVPPHIPPGQPSTSRPLTLVDDRGVPIRSGLSSEESQQLTLGDLHLKQNKPRDAVAAYQRGLARFKDAVARIARPANLTPPQMGEMAAELQKGIRNAYSKLAQAQIAANDIEGAQASLDMARMFKVELVSGTAAATDEGIRVPAKLIITLGKDDLDRAGDDQLAVKKAAKVETIGFPPADRKK